MSLLTLGFAAEFAEAGIAANCLWPETFIATSAVAHMPDGDTLLSSSRSPEIMADAAMEILSRPAKDTTGRCFIDADVLVEAGKTDLSAYGGGENPQWDLFLDKD